jgi:acyl-CoA reductase-like NAD-dependent aldehyde dehydrogenase
MAQMIMNPATLVPLGDVPNSSVDDIERAVAGARAAARSWLAMPATQRGALLQEIGGRIRGSTRELAELLTQESGLARCEALDCVRAAAASFDFFAAQTGSRPGPGGGDAGSSGTLAVLAPFNLALPVMAASVGRALAAGLSVVYKPPAQDPLASLELARAFEVLPPGTVNVVTGGPEVGRALAANPGISGVMFTGSMAAGLEIAAAAEGKGKRLELEAGTVDAHIVCRDADLDHAVPAIAWTRLRSGGQACMSGGHLYVERSLAAEFVDRMHQCVGFLDVDDPSKPSTDLGPLVSLDAARKVEDQVGRTLRAGAKLILGGRRFRPSGLPGHFFQPTILTDVKPGSVPAREEILGPVITVTPVTDLAEALRFWREFAVRPAISPAGASIYTGDAAAAARALEVAAEGFFRINDPAACEGDLGPFGGLRHRGIRVALGARPYDASDRRAKHIEISQAIERKPWWFPYIDRARSP